MSYEEIRRWLLLLGGLVVTGHETIVRATDRPWLLALAAAMMGLAIPFEKLFNGSKK